MCSHYNIFRASTSSTSKQRQINCTQLSIRNIFEFYHRIFDPCYRVSPDPIYGPTWESHFLAKTTPPDLPFYSR